jgi:hypothetical protein
VEVPSLKPRVVSLSLNKDSVFNLATMLLMEGFIGWWVWAEVWVVCEVWADRWVEREGKGGERSSRAEVRDKVRGKCGFSSLMKQKKKAEICFVIYIAGFF